MNFKDFLTPDNLMLTVTLFAIYELFQALITALRPNTKWTLSKRQGFSSDAFPDMTRPRNHPLAFCRPLRPPLQFYDHTTLIFNRAERPNLVLEDDDDVYEKAFRRTLLDDLPREEDRTKFIRRHINHYHPPLKSDSKRPFNVIFADPLEQSPTAAAVASRSTSSAAVKPILRQPP